MFRRARKRESCQDEKPASDNKSNRLTPKTGAVSEPLGGNDSQSNDEVALETLVLGGERTVLDSLVAEENRRLNLNKARKTCPDEKVPAWNDDADDTSEAVSVVSFKDKTKTSIPTKHYTQKLKQKFEAVLETPSWAVLGKEVNSEDDSDTEELTQTTGNYLCPSQSLPQSILDIKRCTDANKQSPAKSKLTCVEFHPSSQVILTAGTNNTLTLFQVDGKQNPKIQSVFLDNYPIYTAHFTTDGEQVVLASKHKSFYYYDLMAGKVVNIPQIKGLEENCLKRFEVSPDGRYLVFLGRFGHIHLLSARSKEWIHSLKMNGSVESVTFSSDGQTMYSLGDDGEVYVWDLHQRDCIHRFVDEGCVRGTSIAISPNNQYLACGSYSGVVNVYDRSQCFQSSRPKPLKAIMNLTTSCTQAKFNSTSEILALSSDLSERAVKLVHCPSLTVFSNFPSKSEPGLRIPLSLDFSLHSGYISVGTHKGLALLYRLKHYKNY